MADFEPVPSFAAVVLFDENARDAEELLRSTKFNPIWLHWFLKAASFITSSGGGGGGAADHNSLATLQGGAATEYYHLNATEYGIRAVDDASRLLAARVFGD